MLQQRLSLGNLDFSSKEYQETQREYNRLEKIVLLKEQYQKYKKLADLEELLSQRKTKSLLL